MPSKTSTTSTQKARAIDAKRIAAKKRNLAKQIDKLDGIDLMFANDLLEEYARTYEMVIALGDDISSEGVMVEVEKGGANNRHTEKVENPAFGTYYKATQRLTDLAKKISLFVKQGKDEEEEEDDIVTFNRRLQ